MHADAQARRMFGKAAPAAADFQHAVAGAQAELVDDALVLGGLRRARLWQGSVKMALE
jgi:hypothetical protein